MPTFDVVSEVDLHEVKNALDQASREVATRFDFKDTGSSIEFAEKEKQITLLSSADARMQALIQVVEEKLVKRGVSLKALDRGKPEPAAKGNIRQVMTLNAGISSDNARKINKFLKDLKLKGVSSQTQDDQIRVSGKKRDDLQAAIAALKDEDFGIPMQFQNFRD